MPLKVVSIQTLQRRKSDPKTGESTKATYSYVGPSYTSYVEHTFKDGSKTSEQNSGSDGIFGKNGKVIIRPSDHTVSSSKTDPSGNKTTKTFDGNKVVKTSQFDARFNETTTTYFDNTMELKTTTTGRKLILRQAIQDSARVGKLLSDVTRSKDGTTTTWSFDANGNANGRVIKNPDGTTDTVQSVPGGHLLPLRQMLTERSLTNILVTR